MDVRGGIRPIAKKTGLSRETLYRMLSATGNPMLKNLVTVINAAGVPLSTLHLEQETAVRNTKTIPHTADRK
ncbi:helix-turn-helix domain-containing transcriptional regulator [Yersinia enterocolitica]